MDDTWDNHAPDCPVCSRILYIDQKPCATGKLLLDKSAAEFRKMIEDPLLSEEQKHHLAVNLLLAKFGRRNDL